VKCDRFSLAWTHVCYTQQCGMFGGRPDLHSKLANRCKNEDMRRGDALGAEKESLQ
jgi:hypothetical protein